MLILTTGGLTKSAGTLFFRVAAVKYSSKLDIILSQGMFFIPRV